MADVKAPDAAKSYKVLFFGEGDEYEEIEGPASMFTIEWMHKKLGCDLFQYQPTDGPKAKNTKGLLFACDEEGRLEPKWYAVNEAVLDRYGLCIHGPVLVMPEELDAAEDGDDYYSNGSD